MSYNNVSSTAIRIFRPACSNAAVAVIGLGVTYFSTRPRRAGRGSHPISIAKTYSEPVEWPVFGEQIDIYTASIRPESAVGQVAPKQPYNAIGTLGCL